MILHNFFHFEIPRDWKFSTIQKEVTRVKNQFLIKILLNVQEKLEKSSFHIFHVVLNFAYES